MQQGTRLEIYWPQEKRYYKATVKTERPRKRENYLICYDEKKSVADREWIDLHRHKFRILSTPAITLKVQKPSSEEQPKEVVVLQQHLDEHDSDGKLWDSTKQAEKSQREEIVLCESTSSENLLVENRCNALSSLIATEISTPEVVNKQNDGISPHTVVPSRGLIHARDDVSANVEDYNGVLVETAVTMNAEIQNSFQDGEHMENFESSITKVLSAPFDLASLGIPPAAEESSCIVDPITSDTFRAEKAASPVLADVSSSETNSPQCWAASRSALKGFEDEVSAPASEKSSVVEELIVTNNSKPARIVSNGESQATYNESKFEELKEGCDHLSMGNASRRENGETSIHDDVSESDLSFLNECDEMETAAQDNDSENGSSKWKDCDISGREEGVSMSHTSRRENDETSIHDNVGERDAAFLKECEEVANADQDNESENGSSKSKDCDLSGCEEEGVIIDPESDPATRAVVCSLIEVGSRVSVYWEENQKFHPGTVTDVRIRGIPFFLEYDDGDEEWIDLRKHKFRLLLNKFCSRRGNGDESRIAGRVRRASNGSNMPGKSLKRIAGENVSGLPKPLHVKETRTFPAKTKTTKGSRKRGFKRAKTSDSTPDKEHGNSKLDLEVKSDSGDESDASCSYEDNVDTSVKGKKRTFIQKDRSSNDISKIGVGSRVAVWWDGDKQYYTGIVKRERVHKKPFFLVYDDGEEEEWMDFQQHKFMLLPPAPPERKKRGRRNKNDKLRPHDCEMIQVGSRVAVWWSCVSKFCYGTVTRKRTHDKPFFLKFDNVSKAGHWIDFTKHTFRLLDIKGSTSRSDSIREKERSGAKEFLKKESNSDDHSIGITVGTRVAVYWEGDLKYYEGVVTRERKNGKKRHYLEYDDCEAAHWINFKDHWVRVLPDTPEPKQKRKKNNRSKGIDAERSKGSSDVVKDFCRAKEQQKKPAAISDVHVGSRVEIWWSGDRTYYKGLVTRVAGTQKFFVKYDDGEEEWIYFSRNSFRLLHDEIDESENEEIEEKSDEDDTLDLGNDDQSLPADASADEASDAEDHSAYVDFVYGDVAKVNVGSRLAVWWPGEKKYFDGTVTKVDDSRKPYFIEYDDDDEEWTDLRRRYFRFLD